MLLRQHVEDLCTDRVREYLESKSARGALDLYERDFLRGLQQGLKFTHADLYARRAILNASEMELFDHLNRGFEGLCSLMERLGSIGALNPRQRVICAAIELGFDDLYHIHYYLSFYAPPPVSMAAM